MTNKSLRGEDEIAKRGVKSYTMAPGACGNACRTIFMPGVLHLYSSRHKRFCVTPSGTARVEKRR